MTNRECPHGVPTDTCPTCSAAHTPTIPGAVAWFDHAGNLAIESGGDTVAMSANEWLALRNSHDALVAALDPDTLEAIADEIGGEFKHSARAASLRFIAGKQRAALKSVKP